MTYDPSPDVIIASVRRAMPLVTCLAPISRSVSADEVDIVRAKGRTRSLVATGIGQRREEEMEGEEWGQISTRDEGRTKEFYSGPGVVSAYSQ